MKIGINRWTLSNNLSLPECFQIARQTGFDSIEINIAEEGYLTPQSREDEVRAIVAEAESAGIALSSLSTGLGWKYPLTSADASVREQGAENIRRQDRKSTTSELQSQFHLVC